MPSGEYQDPYQIICYAAQVLDDPRPSWPRVFAVIKRVAGSIPLPPLQSLRTAHGEFRRVPQSRALGF